MTEHMKIYEQVRAVPPEALKAINGGRLKGMSDINPMWRIKMLTEMFGICGIGWKIEITDKRLEHGGGDEIVCFVDILLSVKVDGEWSAPIPGMGGSSFVTAERNGIYTSDECYKMAYTDAISVACKSLGFAADVYFDKDRTKYTHDGDAPQASQNRPASTPNQSTNQQTKKPISTTAASSNGPFELATENQVKMLRVKRGLAGFKGNDEINKFLGLTLNSLTELPKSKVNTLIKYLDENKKSA
ncbi:hypothetical protein BK133_00970 [Paenibacillus sp. FSL H8-0548]|uniref:hypothetical protein n=1 Tax=Paenibacillus sp. FSL H8-0548 TaxID=1920422 RepID=UPI00096D31EE|nr:hypothetical protein [Paenibacillus sp. FSL H8-0548]OMF38806.1 hypothetical protein BK133_00970 [Paenibacillus sp. FSL H8-0548]